MIQPISKAEIRYGDTNQGFITLRAVRNEEGGMDITIIDAFFRTDTGNEIPDIIADFKRRVSVEPQPEVKPKSTQPQPKPTQHKTTRDGRRLWTAEEKADIIRRYQAGEGPKAIGDSLGVNRNTIQQIIHAAGVTEGRTGQNLKKKQPEALPEAERKEPV